MKASAPHSVALISLLAILSAIIAFSIDIYLPVLTQLEQVFHVPLSAAQLSLSVFFVVVAIAQLFVGGLADFFGRRHVLVWGLGVYALGSLVCLLSFNLSFFILGRMLQAVGACATMTAAISLVRILFPGRESLKVYTVVSLAITCAPAIAPPIGAVLSASFGWRSIFILLLLLAFALLYCVKRWIHFEEKMSEGHFSFRRLLEHYPAVLKEKTFIRYASVSAITVAALMMFVTGSPYLLMVHFQLDATEFALLFSLNAIVMILSSLLAKRLSKQIDFRSMIITGAIIVLLGGIVMWIFELSSLVGFILPMLLVSVGLCFLMPASITGFMSRFEQSAGSAAGMGGAFRYIAATAASLLVAYGIKETVIMVPVFFILSAIVILFLSLKKA